MITIIHGEDIVSSRRFFIDERKKSLHPITFSGDNLDLTDIAQAVEGNSLFDIVNKEIFIEDLFSKKQSQEFSGIVSYLQKHSRSVNIKIWESKELSKTQISLFKNANIKHFFLPKALFAFLNELKPNNSKKMIGFFHKTLESLECELIFFYDNTSISAVFGNTRKTFGEPNRRNKENGSLAKIKAGKSSKIVFQR